MEIDFLAVSHSINSNVKQTGAWLVANRDTENIFNLLFTYSDLRHLMADDEPEKDPEGKTCRTDIPNKGRADKTCRQDRPKTGQASQAGSSHRSYGPDNGPAGKAHRPRGSEDGPANKKCRPDGRMNGPASQADPAAILYFRESCTEFINSFKLAESAFYRYAFAALRNALEAGIMSVISQEAGDAMDASGSPGPGLQHLPAGEMIGMLNSLSNMKKICKKTDIIEKCRELHQELSALSGGKDAAPGLGRDVPPVSAGFDEKVFIRWTVCLRKTIRLLFTIFILKYPVALLYTPVEKKFSTGIRGGPFLNSEERESLIDLIDGDDLDILMNISKSDTYAVHMAAILNSCPDVVEEEFNRQLENFKKELKKKTTGKTGGL